MWNTGFGQRNRVESDLRCARCELVARLSHVPTYNIVDELAQRSDRWRKGDDIDYALCSFQSRSDPSIYAAEEKRVSFVPCADAMIFECSLQYDDVGVWEIGRNIHPNLRRYGLLFQFLQRFYRFPQMRRRHGGTMGGEMEGNCARDWNLEF